MKRLKKSVQIVLGLLVVLTTKAFSLNLDFSENTLVSCNIPDNDVGKECIYNVAPGVYAFVIVSNKRNAELVKFDNTSAGEDKAFQPVVRGTSNKNWGYVTFTISFWDSPSKTKRVFLDEVQVTAVDIDGDGSGNSKEGVAFYDFVSYTLESNTNIDNVDNIASLGYKFYPSSYDNQPGINYNQNPPLNMVSVLYRKVTKIVYRVYVYNNLDSGNTDDRLFSIYFGDTYNGNPFPDWQSPSTTQVGAVISGFIKNDTDADGDISSEPGINKTTVYCYTDDVDGTPGNNDTPSKNILTGLYNNQSGFYSFTVPVNKTYWIVVDSKKVPPQALNAGFNYNDVWAEQTYAPEWGLCDTDADPSTPPSVLTSAGVCFGGAYGDKSDSFNDGANNYDITKAEHIAKLQIGTSDKENIDFGFSFNVVTNTNDRDDDTNTKRTCQGCLRQFIQNANAISGPNSMHFVPAVPPNKTNYWSVQADHTMTDTDPFSTSENDPVFRITDADTTIDGTAYSYQDGKTVRDENPGQENGFVVGYINTCTQSGFEKPELEIFTSLRNPNDNTEEQIWNPYTNKGATILYTNKDNFTVKNISAYGGHYAIFVDGGNNADIEGNFLGIPASGLQDPGQGKRSNRGVVIASPSKKQLSATVRHNLTGYTRLHGIFAFQIDGNNSFLIEENRVEYPSKGWEHENGIGVEIETSNIIVRCNAVRNSCGVGIETWKSDGGHTIESNLVEKTGLDNCSENPGSHEKIGIRLTSSNNTVRYNVVKEAGGSGIVVAYDSGRGFEPANNLISKNSIFRNGGISIDLLKDGGDISIGDGVTPNNGQTDTDTGNIGIDYPVFTKTEIAGTKINLKGYIGTVANKLSPPQGKQWKIEIYKADNDGNNNGEIEERDGKSVPHGEGKDYITTITLTPEDFDNNGNFSKSVPVTGIQEGDYITAILIDENNNTSEFSANSKVISGNKIYGYVYHDGYNSDTQEYTRPNNLKDSYEKWKDKTTAPDIYVKLCDTNGSVISVKTLSDGDGYYQFDSLENGTYTVIVDNDNNTDNCDSNLPEGWISTTPSSINVSLSGEETNVNFGLFHGSEVKGVVFEDRGNGKATSSHANNSLFDSDEHGIEKATVKICKTENCTQVIDSTKTDKNGNYVLYIPYNINYENEALNVVEEDKTGYTSTGNTKGNTVPYKNSNNSTVKERNIITFVNNSGTVYTDYNFGDIKKINIQPEHAFNAPAGNSLSILHTITPGTPGKLFLELTSEKSWNYTVFDDKNCDGNPDGQPAEKNGNYYQLNSNNPVDADNDYCVIIKTVVPSNAQKGTQEKLTVKVLQNWTNTDTTLDDFEVVEDSITVSGDTEGMLYLEKFVKNVSQNGEYTKQNQAKPCDILEYKIVFKNIGSKNIKQLSINDNIPSGTQFLSGAYSGKDVFVDFEGNSYTASIGENPDTDGAEIVDNALHVYINEITGKSHIEPGEEGYILYRVRIKGDNCQ